MTSPESPFWVFLEPEALRINKARQEHLASLQLDIVNKRVLEVGAGIGLHTGFFEERGCDVVSTDGSAINVAEMMRRYPHRKLGVLDLDRAAELSALGMFDLVYCYGTLYHLSDPEGALARLATICDGQILIETLVLRGKHPECHFALDPPSPNQSIHRIGTRPTRPWVMESLRRNFGYSYSTLDQPDYPDFVTDWELMSHNGNLRAVFVGSKYPLALSTLSETLPKRHRNAPVPSSTRATRRVWIDVGAHRGASTRRAALDDPELVVHAFEPLPTLIEELSQGPRNYVVHAMAVSSRDGIARFHVNTVAAASSLLPIEESAQTTWIEGHLLKEDREILVPTVRLDTFMDEAGIVEVEFLKVDAQGADFSVIQSAGERLRDIRKIQLKVAVTSRQLHRSAADKATVIDYLEAHGFILTDVELQSHGQEEHLTFVR